MIRADLISRIRALPPAQRRTFLEGLPPTAREELLFDWRFWARPEQLPPDGYAWRTWVILAGRGFGKTRTGAEWVISVARANPNARIALIGPTTGDIRDVMVRGESGIIEKSPPSFEPKYEPSKRLLSWPNGAIAQTRTAEEPRRIRGPQFTHAWCDEISTWQYAQEAWDMLRFTMRLKGGQEPPRTIVTTTPQPTSLIRSFVKDAMDPRSGTIITRGSTHANRANLTPSYIEDIERRYMGTRLWQQEVEGAVLEDILGALWRHTEDIADRRVDRAPPMRRIVIGVDPAVSTGDDSDLTGIVVVGVCQDRAHGYVLEDISGRYSPLEWAKKVVDAYNRWGADRIVVERNQGGQLVESNLRAVSTFLPITTIHASKGKFSRAEPVATLYQRGLVHHVGVHDALELELTTYSPQTARKSPDRLDALVYALTDAMLSDQPVHRSPGAFVV